VKIISGVINEIRNVGEFDEVSWRFGNFSNEKWEIPWQFYLILSGILLKQI
jgi:hypothetical protein